MVGSTDQTAIQMLALAQREGKSLSRRSNGVRGFLVLIQEETITTVADQANYDMPSGFRYLIDETLWDRTNFWELRGPMTPQQWQVFKSGLLASGAASRRRVRVKVGSDFGKELHIDPVPSSSGDTLVYEYVSDLWCQSSGGTGQSAWADDTDTGILDEDLMQLGLIWRFLKKKGLDYSEEFNEYEIEVKQALARDGGSQILDMSDRADKVFVSTANIQDGNWDL